MLSCLCVYVSGVGVLGPPRENVCPENVARDALMGTVGVSHVALS